MDSTIINIKFINSTIQWLSEFHDSPLNVDSPITDLTSPRIIYRLFKILLDEEDFAPIHINWENIYSLNLFPTTSEDNLVIPKGLEEQINSLEKFLESHLNNAKKKVIKFESHERFETILKQVNFFKLIVYNDIQTIAKFCEVLFRIGTFSSKISTFGLTSIKFLSDSDKMIINEYFSIHSRYYFILNEINDGSNAEGLGQHQSNISYEYALNSELYDMENYELIGVVEALRDRCRNFNDNRNHESFNYTNEIGFNPMIWENILNDKLIYQLMMRLRQ